jgi:ankyrin repeat protein
MFSSLFSSRNERFLKAVETGHMSEVVRLSMRHGKDIKNVRNSVGATALHIASANGRLEAVKYFVLNCGTDIDDAARNGFTPLHAASLNGKLNVVKYLVEKCGANIRAVNENGQTALDLAHYAEQTQVVAYLEARSTKINVVDTKGRTPFHVAEFFEKDPLAAYLESRSTKNASSRPQIASDHAATAVVTMDEPTQNRTGLTDVTAPSFSSGITEMRLAQFEETLRSQNQRLEEILASNNNQNGASFTEVERDILVQVIGETCRTQAEEDEKQAILVSHHAEFYIWLCRKLYCMISAFEVLSSGAVDHGSGETMRSMTGRLLRETSYDVLRETKIGVILANIVGCVKRNLAVVPLLDTVGSICQLILTFKDERDQYMSVARVADFATMVSITSKADGLRCTVERFARIMVRARCGLSSKPFVETHSEFGKVKQLIVTMLGDSGNTPAKELACKAADCCFAHLMKPNKGSVLDSMFRDPCWNDQMAFHEVMAAATLEIRLDEIGQLNKFTRDVRPPTESPNNNAAMALTSKLTVLSTVAEQSNAHGTIADDADAVDEFPMITNTADVVSELAQVRRELSMLKCQLRAAEVNRSMDAGGGMMHADHREKYKDDMDAVIDKGKEHREQIASLTSKLAVLLEKMERLNNIAQCTVGIGKR